MATIIEVAEEAGVSLKTAARILAGGSPQSKKRELVLRCARKLGYVRNQQAANLRTGRSKLVGIIVPFIDNPFYTKSLQELHDALMARGYQSLIACSFGQSATMLSAFKFFESYNVDGVVVDISEGILTPEIQERMRVMQARDRPVMITGGQEHDIPHDHLFLDNQSAIERLVRHLVNRGYRSIGLLGGLAGNLNIKNRVDGFKAVLKEAKLPVVPEWISLGDPGLGSVTQRAFQLLRADRRPAALICTSDMIAMVVLKVASEAGLRVPGDLAVTGFDDIDQAALLTPGLTTVRQPLRTMANDIADLLVQRLGGDKSECHEKRYEAELVIREST